MGRRRDDRERRARRRDRNDERRDELLAPDRHPPRVRDARRRFDLRGQQALVLRVDVDAEGRGRAQVELRGRGDAVTYILPAVTATADSPQE